MTRGITYSPRWGECRVYVTVNPEHGPPREVWIDVDHKQGSVLVGIGHALARVMSHALQGGTSAADIAHGLIGTDGGPADVADCDGVTRAESLPDLVGQVLAAHLAAG